MKRAVIIAALLLALLLPFSALAGNDAKITDYKKDMTITENGEILVNETLTYQFTDSVNGITRIIDKSKSNGIADFTAGIMEDGVLHEFEYVSYADSGDKYLLTSEGDRTVEYRLYLPMRWGATAEYHYSYRILGAAIAYPDIAYLKYALLEGEWELEIENFTATLHLPAPVPASECDLRLTANHAKSATFVYDESEGVFTITAQNVPDENLIGARLYFPASYMPSAISGGDEPYLDKMLYAERAADERAERVNSAAVASLWFFPLLLALFAAAYLVCDRDPDRLVSPGDIRGELPDDVPPAELSLLLPYRTSPGGREISAVLMDLCSRGYIAISTEGGENEKIKDSKVTLTRTGKEGALRDYEALTMRYIFDTLADGEDSITLKQMKKSAEKHYSAASKYNRDFTESLGTHMKSHGWFEGYYTHSSPLKYISGAVLLAAGVIYVALVIMSENLLPLIPAMLCFFLGTYSFCMRKRTEKGCSECVKWLGLKEWLSRNESQEDAAVRPADWERMLVYAGVLLDDQDAIAKRAGSALRTMSFSSDYSVSDYGLLYMVTRSGGTRLFSDVNRAVSGAVSSSGGSSSSGSFGGGGGGGGTF